MKFNRLLKQSEKLLGQAEASKGGTFNAMFFAGGAAWMHARMREMHNGKAFDPAVNYVFYGFLKYLLSLAGFALSVWLFLPISYWLLPLSIVVFYFIEIHFLFLFPLLVDGAAKPLAASFRATYKTGLFTALFTVMAIGFYMLAGLLYFRAPLRNWYAGCYSILIWYDDEIRDRL